MAAAGHRRLLARVGERAPGPVVVVVTDAPAVGAVRYAVRTWGPAVARAL